VVGLFVGGYDGYTRGGKVHLIRGLSLGLVFGAVGAMFGSGLGSTLANAIAGKGWDDSGLATQTLGRTLVFVPIGLFLGAAIGGSSLTAKRVIQGAIGGAIGGAVGGGLFDTIGKIFSKAILTVQGQTHGEVGGPPRAIAFMIMGAAIGLFIGLVERLTRSAWIRIQYGRNEFKEFSIDSSQTFLGRSESATVPLMGDPNVQPSHAQIQKQGPNYVLIDGGSAVGTVLNGQFVQQAVLTSGSTIQIASFSLQFLLKGSPAPTFAPDAGRQIPRGPQTDPYSVPDPVRLQTPSASPFSNSPVPAPQSSNPTVAYGGAGVFPTVSFSIVALDGPMAGQKFPVSSPVEVGREGAQVKLTGDANASRRHASIAPSSGGVRVTDLGSTNGTFVNGQRVQTADVRQGDVIKIGATSFRVEAA
jgi:pSer/pThr/pTyr-binding forkhead associated (FHA) protein